MKTIITHYLELEDVMGVSQFNPNWINL